MINSTSVEQHRDLSFLSYLWVVLAVAVCAVLALAGGPAGNTGVEALTVFLLALAFLAVASPSLLFAGTWGFELDGLLRIFHTVEVIMVVGATVARAILTAKFP